MAESAERDARNLRARRDGARHLDSVDTGNYRLRRLDALTNYLIAPTRPLPPSPPPGSKASLRWTLAALLREARARPLTELGSDASGDETDETRYGRGDETDETRTRPGSRAEDAREDARRLISRATRPVTRLTRLGMAGVTRLKTLAGLSQERGSQSSTMPRLLPLGRAPTMSFKISRLVGADSLAKRVLRDCELFQRASVVTASCALQISQDLPRSP